jgi:hypothetical protein
MGTLTINMGEAPPVEIGCETGKVSDGYHTFDELYNHRCLLFLAFQGMAETHYDGRHVTTWKSRKHHDGSFFDGWFIAGMIFADKSQISYHVTDKYWDLCKAPELEAAPEWDGHTSADVIERLTAWLNA